VVTKTFPDQKTFWTEITPRIERALWDDREAIWQLCGLYISFGPREGHFTGDSEGEVLISELTKLLVVAMAMELQSRENAFESPPGRGRPINHVIRYLGPELVAFFLRYSDSGGRHSVLTSVDGKLSQMEAGPLFEFAARVLVILNRVMVDDLDLKPLSPARVIRCGLAARR
jgi:hypothetical protein